jgi:hypothetical protein
MAANGTWSAWTDSTVSGYDLLTATFSTLTGTDATYSNTFSLDTSKLAMLSIYVSAGLGDTITLTLQYSFDSGSTWIDVSTTYFTTGAITDAAIANSYIIVPQNFDAPLYRFKLEEGAALDGADDVSIRISQLTA